MEQVVVLTQAPGHSHEHSQKITINMRSKTFEFARFCRNFPYGCLLGSFVDVASQNALT